MHVGIIADSHAALVSDIPRKVTNALSSVDLVIHAGDFTSNEVLRGLQQLTKVKAVHGNMDSGVLKAVLPIKEILEINNYRIGITHGTGGPVGIEERVRCMFNSDQVDIIIYGHSHRSQNKVIDGILFFNPGKTMDSFGILTIDEEVRGEILSSW